MTATTDGARQVRRSVLIAYGALGVIGAGFFALSFQYDFTVRDGLVGPALLPRVAGAILAVIGLLLALQEWRSGSVLAGDSGSDEQAEKLDRRTVVKLLSVFGGITAALLITPVIGLLPALTLLALALMIVVERMPVVTSLIIGVAAGVVGHLLFGVVLQVPLPLGVFEGVLG